MHGINEVWMLQVALTNGVIKNNYIRSRAEVCIKGFLNGGTGEDPKGADACATLAENLLKQIHTPTAPNFKPIVEWFAAHKKKHYFMTVAGRNVEISAAPMDGKNPGAVYVRVNHEYVGKIVPSGAFYTSGATLEETVAKQDVLAALAVFSIAREAALMDLKQEAGVQEIKSSSGYVASGHIGFKIIP